MSEWDTAPIFTCLSVIVDQPEGRHRGCHSCSCLLQVCICSVEIHVHVNVLHVVMKSKNEMINLLKCMVVLVLYFWFDLLSHCFFNCSYV